MIRLLLRPGTTLPARLSRAGLLLALLLAPVLAAAQQQDPRPLVPAEAPGQQQPVRQDSVQSDERLVVSVSARRAESHDRLTLGFSSPSPYRVGFDERGLVVALERPATFVFGPLRETLPELTGDLQVEDEGRSLVLPFAERRPVTHFLLGARLVIDLGRDGKPPPTSEQMPGLAGTGAQRPATVPASPSGKPSVAAAPPAAPAPPPPPAPAETSAAAAGLTSATAPAGDLAPVEVQPVLVRLGVHDEYDRLVFDWPEVTAFELEAGIGSALVRFDQPGRLDPSMIAKTPAGRLQKLRAVNTEEGLAVELVFPSGVSAHAFSLDRRVVVDLAGPKGKPRKVSIELSAPPKRPRLVVPDPPEPDGKPPVPLFPLEDVASRPPTAPTPSPATPVEAPPAVAPEQAAEEAPARPFERPPALRDVDPSGFRIERTDALGRAMPMPLPGRLAPWPEPVVLRFHWPEATRGALMQNGPSVLLVFDRSAPAWTTPRIAALAPELSGLERLEAGEATALSFEVSTLVSAQLHRDGRAWVLDLRPRPGHLDQPLPLAPDLSDRTLQLTTEDAGQPVRLRDPATGAPLVVVPFGEEAGFSPRRRFPRFEILASAQGLFVAPRSESVSVTSLPRAVRIGGVDLLTARSLLEAPEAPAAAEPGRRLLDPEAWRLEKAGEFSQVRQDLQTAVAASRTAIDLTAARLALARFYFGHGLGREALGMLSLMFRDAPALGRDPELLLMAGASHVLAGEYEEAVELLGDPALAGEREARLWQAMLAAAAQDWAFAADRFADSFALAADYVRPVRVRIALTAAEARLQAGDLPGAEEQLAQLEPDLRTAPEAARHQLLVGMTLIAGGEVDRGLRRLREAADSGPGPASARARLLLLERALAAEAMTVPEAIEEIEKLRFAWRGDAFEFALLTRLADLYESQGEVRQALRRLRSAVSNFPGHPGAEQAALRMQSLFADLFDGEAARRLPPLAALSLYDEFKELTPTGARGDAIIEELADRLVEIDLLDRAAALLHDQVEHRLSGHDKSRVGARLALVRLLNREPGKALAALDASGQEPQPPEDLKLERGRLRAKALFDLGRGDEALEVLGDDDSLEADRLRVEIHRGAGRWTEVAKLLDRRLPPAGLPLEREGALQVLNSAVAHVLSHHDAELQHLARSYGEAMADTDFAEAFALLAGQRDARAIASIADQLSAVDQAEAFMADYRSRLAGGPLSALN